MINVPERAMVGAVFGPVAEAVAPSHEHVDTMPIDFETITCYCPTHVCTRASEQRVICLAKNATLDSPLPSANGYGSQTKTYKNSTSTNESLAADSANVLPGLPQSQWSEMERPSCKIFDKRANCSKDGGGDGSRSHSRRGKVLSIQGRATGQWRQTPRQLDAARTTIRHYVKKT